MQYEKFGFHSLEEIREVVRRFGGRLPLSEDYSTLSRPLMVQGMHFENRIAIQPMEGCDGTREGRPSELTRRRYLRFAKSGAALIWFEASAVVPEGRANPRQILLCRENMDSIRSLLEEIRATSLRENGFAPKIVVQATHSGRYSKPNGVPEPIIAYNNPIFEGDFPIEKDRVITDDALMRLEEKYGKAAKLAYEVGFDGMDVKSCHRYLCSELLSAYTRKGRYGGCYENRVRFLKNALKSAQAAVPSGFLITTRLNVYDGFAYPYGFGVKTDGSLQPDLTEPSRLVGELHRELGIGMVNITIGNPYVNPHVNRPYDAGGYIPDEHPLEGVCRMAACYGKIQAEHPEVAVVGSGYSYLRQFSGNLAAGAVLEGNCKMAGFGREAFAYPAFAKAILQGRPMDEKQCCLTCGKCTELMRAGSTPGCVLRDREVYLPLYQKEVLEKKGSVFDF